MEFNDLTEQYKLLDEKINKRIAKVLSHGRFIMGPEVLEFEEHLEEYLQIENVITCANGTDAIQLALMALNIGPGDAVLAPAFTFTATAEPIALLGATPIFIDIDQNTLNISPTHLSSVIENFDHKNNLKLKAVIAVDLFGFPADYDELNKICKKNNLFLIEDAAQSIGGKYKGNNCGTFGDVATTSFFPSKPLGCYGDGGAVICKNDELAKTLRSLRAHGRGSSKYENVRIGINSRLDTIQGAILIEKLKTLDNELLLRKQLANTYNHLLPETLSSLNYPLYGDSAYAQYTVKATEEIRTELIEALKAAGIPSQIYYPFSLNNSLAYELYKKLQPATPISEECTKTVLSLPFSPYMDPKKVELIIAPLMQHALKSKL